MRILKTLFIILLLIQTFISCSEDRIWFRGNTHAHTVICGHADSAPEVVARWYLDHDYNFLILSEHNHFIDPDSVHMPDDRRKDFILIAGEEVTGPRIIHSTAMNIRRLVSQQRDLETKSEIIQNHVDVALEAGGNTILNHPNYQYAIKATDILPVRHLYMFELYNGHPQVNNFGDDDHPSTEEMWDKLLSRGMTIYGVASDDAHHFNKIDTIYSNPGRGWVMVQATELSPDAITKAMLNGDFYSSSGVILSECSVRNGIYNVEIDQEKTFKELTSAILFGKHISGKDEGFTIEFIGPDGKVLAVSNSEKARFSIDNNYAYVRAKISYRRIHRNRGMEEFYAWGQPVFTDERKK